MFRTSLIALLLTWCCAGWAQDADYPYTIATRANDSLGNHRVVIHVNKKTDAVWAHIPWRRRDSKPEEKNILIQDATTGKMITNKVIVAINKEYGDILFQPQTIKGDYYVYYLPYKQKITPYLNTRYVTPLSTADVQWVKKNKLDNLKAVAKKQKKFMQAEVKEFQSIDEFNSFFPMEVIATQKETATLLENVKSSFVAFPEDRFHPIRMSNDIPLRWVHKGLQGKFEDNLMRNEYYAFQMGVLALKNIDDLDVEFTPLRDKDGVIALPASAFTCFNKTGVNWDAKAMTKTIAIAPQKVQALWLGLDLPSSIAAGDYTADVKISSKGGDSQTIKLLFHVSNDILADRGDSDPKRHSRLRWLNSTLGQVDDVIAPYTPIVQKGNSFNILGRELIIDDYGFPKDIKTFFNPSVTKILPAGKNIINSPFRFIVQKVNGNVNWIPQGVKFTKQSDGTVEWVAVNSNDDFELTVNGKIDFDGFVSYKLGLKAKRKITVSDVRLEIPYNKESSQYILGLGNKGGVRPASINWKWDVEHLNQDAIWMGDVNAGLYVQLHDEQYRRPLNTNFYLQHPLLLPASWGNKNNGGMKVEEKGNDVLLTAYSNSRTMEEQEVQHYDFNLLITPFKTIDTEFQFTGRFYHKYAPIDEAKALGANIINIHHGNEINPYINYPFLRPAEMKKYIDEAHSKGLRVKIYNTVRELSYQCPEIFAIRSLGGEVFSDGKGMGHSWLQEHLETNYIAAWYCAETNDAAIVNSGMSRWHNYYVEDMKWLVDNIGIDGIYLDDIAYDRTTMRRVRRMLNSKEPHGLIDLHSCNQFNKKDGFINSALLYMDQFPYINRLWFGEEFNPNSAADFYLIEMSGIPFGLMGEMLQDGGNQYYGVVYGMISRLGWTKGVDPRFIWKAWDDFGIQKSEMFGWWASDCPVKTNQPDVHATAFVKKGTTMIAVANWSSEAKKVKLTLNWKQLGIDPAKAKIYAPAIEKFQEEKTFGINDEITINPQKGWMLVIK